MGTEIFTFSWRRLVHPFTDLDSIGFFDLIAQRRLRLNCRSGMRTYYPYTMSTRSSWLIYVPCFFLVRSLSLTRRVMADRAHGSEKRNNTQSRRLPATIRYTCTYIYTRYRRPYTTHADKRHTYII